MPAVVRVKRRIDEEPLSTLVLGQKRRRVSESENEAGTSESLQKPEFLTTLRLAGTITEQVLHLPIIYSISSNDFLCFLLITGTFGRCQSIC